MPAGDELRLVDLPGVVHRRQRIVAQRAQHRQFRTALIGIVRHHRCSDRSKRRRALSQPPPLHMRAIFCSEIPISSPLSMLCRRGLLYITEYL